MQQLPAKDMLSWIKDRAENAIHAMILEGDSGNVEWRTGNPDYYYWDAATVYHYDLRNKVFSIYIAAILVRPFSREAFEHYGRLLLIDDVNQRLMTMWDSRDYDNIFGYDTSYSVKKAADRAELMKLLYNAESEDDIEDDSPDYYHRATCDDEEYSGRRYVKLKATDTDINYEAVIADDETIHSGGTELMHACAKAFSDFRKLRPEVTEMHFYTDDEVLLS
jgi:hypothetical protein